MRINTYICLDCNEEFEWPHTYYERHGLDFPPYERWDVCPYCGGNFANTHICDFCGSLITGTYIRTKRGEEFCEDCVFQREIGDD